MSMYRFTNDYSEAAHPDVLAALTATNLEGNFGYGLDGHCERAAACIRELCAAPDADVHFLVGGTQTNLTAVAAFLRPHEAVIAASTGHVCVHETGAIEATGHKCIAVACENGKLTPDDVRNVCKAHPDEHMVKPRLVYVSNTTEIGTVYTKEELEGLRAVCDELDLYLYLDGARLGSAIAAGGPDFAELARLCDAFYIGGTKVGALCGEAVVFTRPGLDDHFFTLMKKRGALLAKGRFLGLQFDVLFEQEEGPDGTLALRYENAGRHAVELAQRLADGFHAKGYELHLASPTNQQFVVLDDAARERLARHASFGFWEHTPDGRTIVRFATSWATRSEAVDELLALL